LICKLKGRMSCSSSKEDKARLPPKFLMRERGKWRRNNFEKQYVYFSIGQIE